MVMKYCGWSRGDGPMSRTPRDMGHPSELVRRETGHTEIRATRLSPGFPYRETMLTARLKPCPSTNEPCIAGRVGVREVMSPLPSTNELCVAGRVVVREVMSPCPSTNEPCIAGRVVAIVRDAHIWKYARCGAPAFRTDKIEVSYGRN